MNPLRLSTAPERIAAYNHGRLPQILPLKYRKMATDAFHFFRGTAHLFYEDLAAAAPLPASPAAWLCGDLHPENFGSYKGDNRLVYFDISDFDEGLLGPALYDTLRMTTGIFVAFDALNVPGAGEAAAHFVAAYAATLAAGKPVRIETATATGVVKDLLEKAGARKREKWLDKRTEKRGNALVFKTIEGKQLPLVNEVLKAELVQQLATHPLNQSPSGDRFRVLDVCFRLAGTGSLGLKRYLFLLEHRENGKHYLLDMKQAHSSCLSPYVQTLQPPWTSEAERTVTVEDRMLDVDKALMATTVFRGEPYRLEEMQPSEDKVEVADLQGEPEKLHGLLHDAAVLTASAQLRSTGRQGSATADELIGFGNDNSWQRPVLNYAATYSKQVAKDWTSFCKAFAEGKIGDVQLRF